MAIANLYIYGNLDFSGQSASTTRMLYYAKAIANKNRHVYLLSTSADAFQKENFIEAYPNVYVLERRKLVCGFFATIRFLKNLNYFSRTNRGENRFIIYPQSYFFLELFTVVYMIFLKRNSVFFELNEVKKYASNFHKPISIKRIKYSLKTIIYKASFVVVENLMPFYKGLICISTNIETYGKKYNKNTVRIPILTDPEILTESSLEKYNKKDFFNIGFSGSIIPSKENLFQFIQVLEKAKSKGYTIAFNLCGTVSKEDHKLLFADTSPETMLHYYGMLDKKEMANFLAQQDLLVLPRGYTKQNNYGFSTKLSDYLNHKKVVLVTDISDNALYIRDGVNGFVVAPDNYDIMYEKLIYIMDNFESLEARVVSNAIETSKEKFDYRLYGTVLHSFLSQSSIEPINTY